MIYVLKYLGIRLLMTTISFEMRHKVRCKNGWIDTESRK